MKAQDKLVILWTSGDPLTAEKMVFMYAVNALRKAWWHEVTVIVWGASAALCAGDSRIQACVKDLAEIGGEVVACKACADDLGVTEDLEALGIDVMYMGESLTEYLKLDYKILTI